MKMMDERSDIHIVKGSYMLFSGEEGLDQVTYYSLLLLLLLTQPILYAASHT